VRLHYLDWLRVLLIVGVFLYHAVSPFREGFEWHIVNSEASVTVSIILVFFWPWALPLFFLVAGAASLFALRRRFNRQGKLAQAMAAGSFAVYFIHAPVLVFLALALRNVSLHPLIKWALVTPVAVSLFRGRSLFQEAAVC
jgi:peptidoglycan/LPS O-acetylase OafA/YrhL